MHTIYMHACTNISHKLSKHELIMPTVPVKVVNLSFQPSESGSSQVTLTLRWDEPESDVSITHYEGNYRETSSETWMGDFTTTQFTYVYRNLTNEVDYVVRVRAVSAIGAGTYAIKTTSGRLSNVLYI